MDFDDYEQGILQGFVFTGKRWWQFWKPKKVYGDIGTYAQIGNLVQINLNGGHSFVYANET